MGVTPPRHIRPRAVYAISRRTERRRFLLRPDPVLTNLVTWLLALLAEKFEIEVHVAVVMSNHFHLVVTVPNEDVSDFMHRLDMHLANALKILRKHADGVVWEPGKLSIVDLVTTEAVIEEIAYAIVNPCAAGLVHEPADWPGLTSSVADVGRRTYRGEHPGFYFGSSWKKTATHPQTMPKCLRDLGDATARSFLDAEVALQLAKARKEIAAKRGKVLGAIAAANTSPYACPKTPEERGGLRPHVAAGRGQTEARLAALDRMFAFRHDHAACKKAWRAGDRSVVFPAGTYWMRVHHGAAVEPFP